MAQITPKTLVIGIDIAKHHHVARAQDYRGMEPTGHYWLNLAHILKEEQIKFVTVNPLYVKHSKELDDNSPTKNDVKDAKVIAQLVKDGRYAEPTIPQGTMMAKMELRSLIQKYELIQAKFEELDHTLDTLLQDIPGVDQMLEITGIGHETVVGFFAEVGDLNEYNHPRQITKLAGLSLKENTSGKHKGRTMITKRGRKKLRALLFRASMILVAKNKDFKALHHYYTTRPDNPLKKMQSLIALCNKLIRILFSIGQKQFVFQEEKMLKDIPHMHAFIQEPIAA
ncbi:transposase [Metabacillus fastidiosus]|uniref:transposase n=1 Tax=Metabacillus fastidiosus TaxID=1458 RepID=UPI002DB6123D|nr:transposase [Metabacillus fastidiosus]MEC2074489.1 transposase [Metabacillus fastidiosus]